MTPPRSLRRGDALGGVHRPDDDYLLQAGGGRPRGSQLLHQSVQRVRVDGLLLVGFKGHRVGCGEGEAGGLRFELLDDGGVSGGGLGGVGRRRQGFGVRGGRFRVQRLAFMDGNQTFVLLRDFILNEGHGVAGSKEDNCRRTQRSKVTRSPKTSLKHIIQTSLLFNLNKTRTKKTISNIFKGIVQILPRPVSV